MKKNKVNLSIPVTFQKLDTFQVKDTRFTKVKIWLMHLEENLNDSYFSKGAVENALPSLANTPILGYIEANDDGEKDYSDHRSVIVKDNGNFRIKYVGSAYGLIPETNNAQFERRVCDDGIEREFLTCDGLIWNKWDEPTEILNRDLVKSQSMELHKEYTGEWNEDDGLFHFKDFKFFGACILGDDVQPAMRSATVELEQFSADNIWQEIQSKMEDFKTFQVQQSSNDEVDKNSEEGGKQIVDEKLILLGKYSLTDAFAIDNDINLEEISLEDLEAKITEHFALTASQLTKELSMALNPNPKTDEWGWEIKDYYYMDNKDGMVYAMSVPDKWRIVGFSYSMSGDFPVVDFDSKKLCKVEYVTMEGQDEDVSEFSFIDTVAQYAVDIKVKELEGKDPVDVEALKTGYEAKLKEANDTITTLSDDLKALEEFKATKEAEERTKAENDLVERFASELTAEEIQTVMENTSDFTIDDLEIRLYALVGKKAKFSANPPKQDKNGVKFGLDGSDGENKNEPVWANLVRKFSNN